MLKDFVGIYGRRGERGTTPVKKEKNNWARRPRSTCFGITLFKGVGWFRGSICENVSRIIKDGIVPVEKVPIYLELRVITWQFLWCAVFKKRLCVCEFLRERVRDNLQYEFDNGHGSYYFCRRNMLSSSFLEFIVMRLTCRGVLFIPGFLRGI